MAQGTLGGIPAHWGQRMGPKLSGTWLPSTRGSVCAQEWRRPYLNITVGHHGIRTTMKLSVLHPELFLL